MSIEDVLQRGWKSIGMADREDPVATPAGEGGESTEPTEGTRPSRRTGTFIGSGALFEGTLTLRGDFRIDSEFRGELTTDGNIIVGPTGSVVGDIHAREVEILGAVVGDVSARRQLILHSGSRLHGGIETACLEIRKHAFFSGNTRMLEPQTTSRNPIEAPVEPAPAAAP